MWILLATSLALGQAAVDLTPVLKEGRTYLWTHLVTVEETSHWGSAQVQVAILSTRQVELGGRMGEVGLEWVDRVEDVRADLTIGTRTVGRWQAGDTSLDARVVDRFQALVGNQWRVLVKRDGRAEAFELRGEGITAEHQAVAQLMPADLVDDPIRPRAWTGEVPGPAPPEFLGWASGLGFGGGVAREGTALSWPAFTPGEPRRVEVRLPLLGVATTVAALDLTVISDVFGQVEATYVVQGLGAPPPEGRVQLKSVVGTGRLVVDTVHGVVVEHDQDLHIEILEGRRVVQRHEQVSSFLNQVKRKPPRRPRALAEPSRR
ncbi:MAG: hypothetical protein JXX28_08300 [Deltaproteobacteria bacterium]|nr:hypothetical protein [Deltaproteobacteria bacterium]